MLAATMATVGCDTESETESGNLSISVSHHVDGSAMAFDTLQYLNASDNLYSVTRLQYYLDGITFIGASGNDDHVLSDAILVDGRIPLDFNIGGVPVGDYDGIVLTIGIVPARNCTGCLPPTVPNVQMAWPDPMGGGYHFMKFEGHFRANGGTGTQHGFAIHLGNNGAQGHCTMMQPFTVTEAGGTVHLSFNLNAVFHGPNTYDMDTLTYTMGNMPAMQLVAANLANAFTFSYSE